MVIIGTFFDFIDKNEGVFYALRILLNDALIALKATF
jgi:hypothetical protein